ncbi:MAG: helix-turn-helix domain-containing protein [Pseudonocardia sp.]
MAAARAEGRVGGRPAKLTGTKLAHARKLRDGSEHTVSAIAEIVGVSRATVYRALDDRMSGASGDMQPVVG